MIQHLQETPVSVGEPAAGTTTAADLWKQAVALVIETRRMGIRRIVTGHAPDGADPEMVRVSKAILDGPEYRAIVRCDHRLRAEVGKLGLPISAYFKGAAVIPVALLDEVEDRLEAFQAARQAAVEAFIAAYPAMVERARARLGPLFDPADYPPVEALAGLFGVRVQYLTFDLPGVLQHCSERARRRAMAEGQAQLGEAIQEMRRHLREAFAGLVTHLRDRLAPDPVTGARRTLRASSVQGLLEFLDTFGARNAVAGDADLAALVGQARALLAGVELPELRTDEALRQAVQAGLDGITAQLDELLVAPPRRRYDWAEEEAP
ncbi:hypothetical protein [Nitrospira calida]|jgi:hypothetical protein